MQINFNKKIYSQQAIKKAMKDYSNLADFKLNQNENYFLVKIENIQPEIKKNFQDEFSTYVLSLINK
jgi:hypothetical protein